MPTWQLGSSAAGRPANSHTCGWLAQLAVVRDGESEGLRRVSESEGESGPPSGRAVARSTVVNGFASVVSALLTAALTPFLLHRLGPAEYGLWLLAMGASFTWGYLALADLGLAEAAVRLVSEARSRGLPERVADLVASTLAAFAVLGAIASVVLVLAVPWIVELFRLDPRLESEARQVFSLMALEVLVALPTAGALALVEGAHHYGRIRILDLGSRIAWAIGLTVVVSSGRGVVAMGAVSVAVAVLKLPGALLLVFTSHRSLTLRFQRPQWSTVRELGAYGRIVAGLRLLSVVYSQMDRVVLGVLVGAVAVARYDIPYRVHSVAMLFLIVAGSAMVPASAAHAAIGSDLRQRDLFLRGTRFAAGTATIVVLTLVFLAEPIVSMWVGEEYADLGRAVRLFMLIPLLNAANAVGVAMLVGKGEAGQVLPIQTASVGVNLAASVALAPRFGVMGVIIGSVVGSTVAAPLFLRVLLREFGVAPKEWAVGVLRPLPVVAISQTIVGSILVRLLGASDLIGLVAVAAVMTAAGGTVFVTLGLSAADRRGALAAVLRVRP